MCWPDDRDEAPIKSFVTNIAKYLHSGSLHLISSLFLSTAVWFSVQVSTVEQIIPTDLTSSTLPSSRQSALVPTVNKDPAKDTLPIVRN